ncbi:winged helix-turn-helix transcriptional regulator [Deinococcus arenicola]|uniref:Helix-turn-helix domain-containing protein n=1 Tax=Deinococcus arenicola TaxID=2994950 RepID=A0ABU4DWA8_9DEIO|nr:helix-turn-helix domain-containing protein [Deinococcus sp. ZS9-10]MDV6376160.1 helix-turn-helix domain-containing protein [Deinococcus sp. ZS9-10]
MGKQQATEKPRSGCPVSLGLDIFGDKWTLLIVRDLMFNGKRHYREFLQSAEGISSNILADRLKLLLSEGIVIKADDPSHLQKVVYSLTEKGIALLPILMQISAWSFEYRPVGQDYRDQTLAEMVDPEQRVAALRRAHLPKTTNP